jgi:putative flippase GtrA
MTQMILPLGPLASLRRVRLLRYLAASVLALGIDMGSFTILLALGAAAMPAAAAGYALGILAHWLISSRKVFADSVASRGPARTRQKAMFVASALLGLAVTSFIVGSGDAASFDPHLAKLVAIAVSFAATWILRSRIIFADGSPSESIGG